MVRDKLGLGREGRHHVRQHLRPDAGDGALLRSGGLLPDGKTLATSGPALWRVPDGQRIWPVAAPAPSHDDGSVLDNWVAFSPDGTYILVSDFAPTGPWLTDDKSYTTVSKLYRASDGALVRTSAPACRAGRRSRRTGTGSWRARWCSRCCLARRSTSARRRATACRRSRPMEPLRSGDPTGSRACFAPNDLTDSRGRHPPRLRRDVRPVRTDHLRALPADVARSCRGRGRDPRGLFADSPPSGPRSRSAGSADVAVSNGDESVLERNPERVDIVRCP